jgi:cell division protease FtsH
MEKRTQFNFWYVLFAVFAIITLHNIWVQYTTVEPLPYSEFRRLLKQDAITDVTISDNTIQGTLKTPLKDGRTRFVTTRVEGELADELSRYDVKYSRIVENTFLRDILSWILPAVIFVAIWLFAMRRFGQGGGVGGFMALGKSKAKVYVEAKTGVSFDDVAGVDEAKEELLEIVNFLKSPVDYGRLGAHVPKGVLLVGPPGTGKTLLARAVAGEAGVPFFSISGSEFVEMFVGVGAARVRDLFEQARQKAPAIIFIDELDALGRARGAFGLGGHDEKEQTLNQLLVELDGFDPTTGLVLLAATNRPEVLDPALLRAGRFDRQVLVDRPDRRGRLQILAVHMKKIRLAADLEPDKIADLTAGFSGADLANLCNEAALVATRRRAETVSLDDFTMAVERLVAGLEKRNRVLNPHEREVVAYHEMGHALVAMALPGSDAVHKISIIPRGVGALGYTIQRPTEDRFLMTRSELENRMAVLLGGRAAELLRFGHYSTGAADDLQKVSSIARSIVTRFGMDETLGQVVYETEQQNFLGPQGAPPPKREYSEDTARKIDEAVRKLVSEAFERTQRLLDTNRTLLEEGAQTLLSRETLTEAELGPLRERVVGG